MDVRVCDDGRAEERDAQPRAVEPAEALGDVGFGAGHEGLVEGGWVGVWGVVGADEEAEGGGAEDVGHYQGEVDCGPRQCCKSSQYFVAGLLTERGKAKKRAGK